MSLISCCAQWWRQEQTETLNLRGRFEKRRLPTKCVDSSSTIGRESNSSSAVTPASGQPTTLRQTSPQAWALVSPMRSSVVEDLGHVLDAQPVQLQALARRDVAGRAPEAHREVADRAQLLGRHGAVRHAHAQHQVAVLLGPLRVQAPPLREREVVGRERVEAARARSDQQVLQDVEAVLALLDALDLRAQISLSTGHSRAPSSSSDPSTSRCSRLPGIGTEALSAGCRGFTGPGPSTSPDEPPQTTPVRPTYVVRGGH